MHILIELPGVYEEMRLSKQMLNGVIDSVWVNMSTKSPWRSRMEPLHFELIE